MKDFAHLWNFWRKKNLKEKSWKWGRQSPNSEIELILNFKIFSPHILSNIQTYFIFNLVWSRFLIGRYVPILNLIGWCFKTLFPMEYGISITRGYLPGVFNKWIHVILCVCDHIKHRRLLRNKEKMKPLKDAPGYYIINTEIK